MDLFFEKKLFSNGVPPLSCVCLRRRLFLTSRPEPEGENRWRSWRSLALSNLKVISIDEADWQEVWTRAMDISTCNRTKSIQFKILHRTHITPVLKNTMDANASPLCWKCKAETGDYIHCFWSCVKLHLYWSDIVNELSAIFGVSILMDPMCLMLGLSDTRITFLSLPSLPLYPFFKFFKKCFIYLFIYVFFLFLFAYCEADAFLAL